MALALLSGMAAGLVEAAPLSLAGLPTTMMSTADRMISYRNQYHMWLTSDGAMHVLMNRGVVSDDTSLALVSSFDGTHWTTTALLPNSNITSTSDGFLTGNLLQVAYSGDGGQLFYSRLTYDPAARVWTLNSTETAYAPAQAYGLTPTVAVDSSGVLWLAYTRLDLASGNFSINMLLKRPTDVSWQDTGFTFGPVDNISNERGTRLVKTSNGMGLVYTVHQNIYWGQRVDAWMPSAPWQRQLLYVNQAPDTDPYGTHFSAVADSASNVHVASVDGGHVVYSRMVAQTGAWSTRIMTDDIAATYVQVTTSDSQLLVISNAQSVMRVFQSADQGTSFQNTYVLTHPVATTGVSYDRPRMETPTHVSGPVPTLQQYVDGSLQRALYFSVPVPQISKPTAKPTAQPVH